MPNCIICNRLLSNGSFNMKDKYELTGHDYICKPCAEKIGIRNFMAAGMYTAKKAQKKYFDMYPDEAPEYYKEIDPDEEARLDEEFVTSINAIPYCRIILTNELKQLRRTLSEGEEVIHAVNALIGKGNFALFDSRFQVDKNSSIKETWLAALTDTRIILINKHLVIGSDCISIPLEQINSISFKTGAFESTITIMNGVSGLVLENIKKGFEKPFVDKANDAIRNVRTTKQPAQEPKTAPVSTADELLKWHELLKQGIITQEEFDSQKNKLLK